MTHMLMFFNKEVHLYFLETLRLLLNMYYAGVYFDGLHKKLVSSKKLTTQKFMQSFFTIKIGDTSHIKLYEDSLLLKSARRRWCVIATLSLPPARSSWGLHELFSRAETVAAPPISGYDVMGQPFPRVANVIHQSFS